MKKILLLLFCFSFIDVFALTYGGCDYSVVSRMKSMVTNINLSYDYKIVDNEALFSVTINNLTDEMYFYDTVTNKYYYYRDSNNGEITINNYKVNSGTYKFYSNLDACHGISLGNKYYTFPKYNKYYVHELCSDISNYSLCQKWSDVNYSEEEFKKMVLEYKNQIEEPDEEAVVNIEKTITDKIIEIYINYYYYFLGAIILICSVTIIINNRKNKFKL